MISEWRTMMDGTQPPQLRQRWFHRIAVAISAKLRLTPLNALMQFELSRRRTLSDRLLFGWEIVPISDDELRTELVRRCSESNNPKEFWPVKFLRQYRDSGGTAKDALVSAIRCTHRPSQLQHFLFRAYCRDFLKTHAEAVREFHRFFHSTQLIAAHISCQARQPLACASATSFGEQVNLRHLIVVGQESSEMQNQRYYFERERGILRVPAPDTYEGLALKMAMLFRFLGFSGTSSCIMKLDDNTGCVREKFSAKAIIELCQRYNYVGFVSRPSRDGIVRGWHLGKCRDDNINRTPYGLIADCNYANGGAGYFLGPRAVNILARSSVYLFQAFEQEYWAEDLAVGKILKSFGVHPHHYDALEAGIFHYDCHVHSD